MLNSMASLLSSAWPAAMSSALGPYNIDPSLVSVSGFSAGGFMAVQLGIAYSSVFQAGLGVFAGGPYDCARNQDFMTICLFNHAPSIAVPLENMRTWSNEGKIDDLANLRKRRVYLQSGMIDEIVGVAETRQLYAQLSEFLDEDKFSYVETPRAAHAFPTDFDAPGNSDCGISTGPFVANCGYDGAGAVLKWIYGGELISPQVRSDQQYALQSFSQKGPFGAIGLADTGFIYVPHTCRLRQASCRLHVALHGCTMSHEQIGDKFIKDTGYLPWAEANNIIILFPQATVDNTLRKIWNGTEYPGGALACFDWVGWVGENADQKGGVQMAAIVNTVKKLLSDSKREASSLPVLA
ncbi:hypothetical protein AC579_268 [Pseudocercospora musae]|uniref:Peptidase S9 prolyl oligopeptidase catalytic domain-containing protein n=1 Tax=Pseudocercospora musae TaxID=113226 RepID=A0A139I417_9PEZI|nr:hypothetical protein AC579_268 [Pseudocercospora musae]